ncbi:MAG: hypothetical protein R3E08_13465 [Thiotrichaceae bacterium]
MFLINMAVFTWFLSYLELGKPTLEKTPLISNVQAGSTPRQPVALITQNPKATVSAPVSVPVANEAVVKQASELHPIKSIRQSRDVAAFRRTVLQFESISTQFVPDEQVKLETALQEAHISPSHKVVILVGPAPSESNTTSPQTSKLRAQTVARLIYAYTQNIKMLYRPDMEMGRVDVEFYSPKAANKS